MGFKIPINVFETTNTTGTGDLTLAGAASGYRAFSADLSDGDVTLWCLKPNGSVHREFHLGAWNTGGVLTRSASTLVVSTTGALINLGAGPHDVFIAPMPNPPAAFNAQTGTTYTLALTDAGVLVTLDNASAVTLTVPANASVAFPIGTVVALQQKGAGAVTVSPAGGVTINSDAGMLSLANQYAGAILVKTGTDTWWLAGRLA